MLAEEDNKLMNIYNELRPQCRTVDKIEELNSTKCFVDLPVRFALNGTIVDGFLVDDNIITRVLTVESCKHNRRSYLIEKSIVKML